MSDEEKKKEDPYSLKDIFTEMEMDLIQSLQRNLVKHKLDEVNAGFSWEMWQKAMLRNIQKYRNEVKHIIKGYHPVVQDAIKETLRGTYDKALDIAQATLEHEEIKLNADFLSFPEDGKNTAGVGEEPPQETEFFNVNRKKMEALIQSTMDDFENANTAIYRKMDDVYRQTIYKTEIQLASGALSLDAAIDKATEAFLAKGIDCIIYKNGAQVNIASYAEMALRTASQRAKFLADGSKRDEFKRYLVFASAHANSCKLCMPWQGKVLIDDVFSHPGDEYLNKYKSTYKLLSQAIKSGLLHPNCRHTIATYFEGVTRLPEVTDEETVQKNYIAEQNQRKLENAIRKAKRKAVGTIDEKNKRDATNEVRAMQKELRDHLKANPKLNRHEHREKMQGIGSKVISKLDNLDESLLKGADERTILEVDKALAKIYKEYPHLKGIISEVYLIDKGTAVVEIDIQNKGITVSLGINKNLTPVNAKSMTERMYDQHKWTKKPGIEGIIKHEMGHVLNYDYYVKKNSLEYGKSYGDEPLKRLIDDLEKNQLATALRAEVLRKLEVSDTDEHVANLYSSYAKNKSMTNNGEFFAEAFSDYSETKAKYIFMELLKERMK